ncbi:hypothetical protein [Desulfoluna spongiiphila]|uniref:Uncharacterized protein n=2 Tax=Desulfoluna spongiiphila TaxID=419481 RepID=A0A1G5IFA4_9BACT|nr:hypothetical protein [Desulfoluna spongiiphila]SCY74088.1 hypothetical protein SAMN05216233_11948 [Desulfoluna spongiiphila]VVS95399.1 consensus disorder prediction [Desulfoluna spongiiphila]
MPGLDQREKMAQEDRMNRLASKQEQYHISRQLAEYIDMLETHLIEMDERVASLETMLGLRGLEPPQY